ncbi:ABC transporter ATP-binding protein [Bradyrhizobium sp. CIR3A]|uniref:ABC transporter ATP-binding protein n=1 Tax=Bradyrhizobium sp. CIR3A TaxID=2663838 RepID=UPI001606572B|nr:ABC transporter ATP-binding protein [Bradyrhizobium sp. CIR3A]MBB4261352.1 ABC-type branched-subunit amino acid transport system ATPase component [Bradyrhizobium sp. CIR3A]
MTAPTVDHAFSAKSASAAQLEVRAVARAFGGLKAVDGVNLSIRRGELFGIIGPNGSGKTTLFNLLTGYLDPTEGRIWFEGRDITALKPEQIAAAGVARTFQAVRFHREATVRETVWAAQALHLSVSGLFRSAGAKAEALYAAEVDAILEQTWLAPHADRLASELPFGLIRQLEIARALATRPRILLMDEPASGMNPAETRALAADIRRLCDRGLTIILVEHDIEMVMELCERIAVLSFGRLIAEGCPDEVRRNPDVIAAYLGSGRRAHA